MNCANTLGGSAFALPNFNNESLFRTLNMLLSRESAPEDRQVAHTNGNGVTCGHGPGSLLPAVEGVAAPSTCNAQQTPIWQI